MLSRLQLQNFKSFSKLTDIRLKRINLIFGSNSSGKSSLIQSLLLLKQSLTSTVGTVESALVFRGDTDLGGMRNLLSFHELTRTLSIGVSTNHAADFAVGTFDDLLITWNFAYSKNGDACLNEVSLLELVDLIPAAVYRQRQKSSNDTFEARLFQADTLRGDSNVLREFFSYFERQKAPLEKYIARTLFGLQGLCKSEKSDSISKIRLSREIAFLQERLRVYQSYSFREFMDDLDNYCTNVGLEFSGLLPINIRKFDIDQLVPLRDEFILMRRHLASTEQLEQPPDPHHLTISLCKALDERISSMKYIGPLRDFPSRTYFYKGGGTTSLAASGSNLGELLYQDEDALNTLNRFSAAMDLGYKVFVHRTDDEKFEGLFTLRLEDQVSSAEVGLVDVGFGVSQVLPILAQCAIAKSSTLVIEQPELHLNPKLQATLASILAESAVEKDNQLIIETHSEHLLMRFQKLIRTKQLSSDDVQVLYVSKGSTGSDVINLELSSQGDLLDGWPDGFFDDAMRELF